jgi:hypothetical protein
VLWDLGTLGAVLWNRSDPEVSFGACINSYAEADV